jgi:AraC-like DNA-binding protein
VAEPVATEIAVGTDDEDDRLSNLYEMILLKMERNKPYLDPNFSLQVLSQMLNRSERYVSQAINKLGKTNFNRMVVRYRINEARRLITVHGEGVTMNEVGEQSGFANRIFILPQFQGGDGFVAD